MSRKTSKNLPGGRSRNGSTGNGLPACFAMNHLPWWTHQRAMLRSTQSTSIRCNADAHPANVHFVHLVEKHSADAGLAVYKRAAGTAKIVQHTSPG